MPPLIWILPLSETISPFLNLFFPFPEYEQKLSCFLLYSKYCMSFIKIYMFFDFALLNENYVQERWYNALEQSFNALEQPFNALERWYNAFEQSFNTLEQWYNALVSWFNALEQWYNALVWWYNALGQWTWAFALLSDFLNNFLNL